MTLQIEDKSKKFTLPKKEYINRLGYCIKEKEAFTGA